MPLIGGREALSTQDQVSLFILNQIITFSLVVRNPFQTSQQTFPQVGTGKTTCGSTSNGLTSPAGITLITMSLY